MPTFNLQSARSLVRSGFVLAVVASAALGLWNDDFHANAQSTTAAGTTPTAVATTTTDASTTVATAEATPATTTDATFTSGQAVVVNADSLHFRADASIDATINSSLADGTWATIVDGPVDAGDGYAWWQIDVDGSTGWVDGAYLIDSASDSAALPVGTVVMATTDGLNVRETPSLSAAVVIQLASGDTATVVAGAQTADDYAWYQLDVNGVTGWAVRNYLAFAPSDVATPVAGKSAMVNTNALALRDSPSTSGAELSALAGGTDVTIVSGPTTADNLDWYEVSVGSTTGWVAGDYLRIV